MCHINIFCILTSSGYTGSWYGAGGGGWATGWAGMGRWTSAVAGWWTGATGTGKWCSGIAGFLWCKIGIGVGWYSRAGGWYGFNVGCGGG